VVKRFLFVFSSIPPTTDYRLPIPHVLHGKNDMVKVNILTNHTCPASRAFNTPLMAIARQLKADGIELNFLFSSPSMNAPTSDILMINSNVFRPWWSERKEDILRFLEHASNAGVKIFWFDTTDSTWSTQFEVLPLVDKFLKNQIFADKKLYLKKFRTGRIFTDYFASFHNVEETDYEYSLPKKDSLEKIGVSWAPCFESYTETRYSVGRKLINASAPYAWKSKRWKIALKLTSPSKRRAIPLSSRFGFSHPRSSVIAHRKAVAKIAEKFGADTERIPLPKYFRELRDSRLSLSPFGVGEFCYRDYESIACGATLVKPDMTHMTTWPELYKDEETVVFHKWDLSDLEDVIKELLNDDCKRIVLAENAAKILSKAVSAEGLDAFAQRLKKTIRNTD
jgi:hypothetical protein